MAVKPRADWEIAQQGAVVTADLEFFPDKPRFPKGRPQRLRQRRKPPLTIGQILAWADAHFERTGKWPNRDSGEVFEAPNENWSKINAALAGGWRGIPTNSGLSLTRLLAEFRGLRNIKRLPHFTIDQILRWADAHFARTGVWPQTDSGDVLGAPGETWAAIDHALWRGGRGLPTGPGLSLARLLAEHREVRNLKQLARLSIKQILSWADAHFQRTGEWPGWDSGKVTETTNDTWSSIDRALQRGLRGLSSQRGSTLARLLAKRRGVRHPGEPPPFTIKQILAWADAHFRRCGQWPGQLSGVIFDAPSETWKMVDHALRLGIRGFPANTGLSLARLLARHRGVRVAGHPFPIHVTKPSAPPAAKTLKKPSPR